MQDAHLHIGDRVVTIEPLSHAIPMGIIGTVIRVYLSLSDCYEVRFDSVLTPSMVFGASVAAMQVVGTGTAQDS